MPIGTASAGSRMGPARPGDGPGRNLHHYNVGCVYALSGESEKAIEYLEKATAREDWYKGWAQKDSDLDSLRSHSRFQALLK
jgi:adenylate cyclase